MDVNIFYFINKNLQSSILDCMALLFTDIGVWQVPLILIWMSLFVLGDNKLRFVCILGVIALGISDIFTAKLKYIFKIQRPYRVLEDVRVLTQACGYSFPSCHSANLFSVASLIFFMYNKKLFLGIILFSLACLISLLRIYQGVHYPSDILAGGALGFLIGWLLSLVRYIKVKKS